jgi:hypothetical protein
LAEFRLLAECVTLRIGTWREREKERVSDVENWNTGSASAE